MPKLRTRPSARFHTLLWFSLILFVIVGAPALAPAAPAQVPSAPTLPPGVAVPSSTSTATTQATTPSNTSSSAEATAARGQLGDTEVVAVGRTGASGGGGGSADASVISLFGNEIAGAHADADEGNGNSTTGLTHASCAMSEGSLCLALLYGNAETTENGGTSSSSARAALASLCLGGEQTDASDDCDGPVTAGVAESDSTATTDATSTSASESSTLARACVGDDPETDVCDGIGLVLLHASSDSTGATESSGFGLWGGGEEIIGADHPGGFGTCEEGGCLEFNLGSAVAGAPVTEATVASTPGSASASASGVVLHIEVFDEELVTASGTGATTGSDGSSSDATVLSLLGHELIGAHADATGGSSEDETGYGTETCEASDGSLCIALLYGHAEAADDASSSSSSSHTLGGSICLGGTQTDPDASCDGPIGLTVAESNAMVSQDKGTGAAGAEESTSVADLCLGGEDTETGTCDGLGVIVLSSESSASASPGEDGTSDGGASLVTVESGGEESGSIDQEQQIALPPDCPADGSLVCIVLNEVNTSAGAGSAESGATAVEAIVGRTTDGDAASGDVSDGSAGASTAAGREPRVLGERVTGPDAGALARTGGSLDSIIALGLISLVLGMHARRRARVVD